MEGKIDFVKQDKQLYAPKTDPTIVDIPPMLFLMYDGAGAAEDNPAFQQAFNALFGIAYSIKFMGKRPKPPEGYQDFKVPPPEGLWWMADDGEFDQNKPQLWRWTLMLRMPSFVTADLVKAVAEELVAKKMDDSYRKVRLEEYTEGTSVQLMHIGPYDQEQADLAKLQAFTDACGASYTGKHHELYFGDPRRTKPEKLKTVLRHTVILAA